MIKFCLVWILFIARMQSDALATDLLQFGDWLQLGHSENEFKECVSKKSAILSDDPFQLSVRIDLARCYRRLQDLENAVKNIHIAQNFAPSNSKVLEEAAMQALQSGNFLLCKKTFDHLLSSYPEVKAYLFPRSRCLKKLGNLLAAADDLRILSQEDPSQSIFQTELADIFILMGNLVEARKHLLTASKLDPGAAHLWEGLGDLDSKRKSFDTAEISYQKSLEINKNNFNLKEKLFTTYFIQKKYALAEQIGLEILQKMPASDYVAKGMMHILIGTEQFSKLSLFLQKYSETNPNLAWPYIELAKLQVKVSDYPKAEKALLKSLEINGNELDLLLMLAFVRDMLGRQQEALEALKVAETAFPNNGKVYFNQGLIYEKLGNTSGSIQAYSRVKGDSDLVYKSKVNLSLLLESSDQIAESIAVLRSIKTLSPQQASLVDKKLHLLKSKSSASRSIAKEKEINQ